MGRREQPDTSRRGTLRNTLSQNLHQNGTKAYSKVQTKLPHSDASVNCSWSEATFPNLMDKLIVFCSFCPVKMRRDETLHRNISSSWPMKSRHDDTLWTSKVMAETMTAIGKNDGRGGRIQWRYLSGARANAILSMTAIHCNTRYFCIYLHVCLCYVQPCIIRFFVFHMVLRTAIYIIIVYIVKENKSFTYKICHSVFWISYL